MKKIFLATAICLLPLALTSCDLEEQCENEAEQIRIVPATGSAFLIDKYEASRSNATSATSGVGVTLACNLPNAIPWGNVTYEDARNACLDAGKRLCTREEWMAACGAQLFPYGPVFDASACPSSVESMPTGSHPKCSTKEGVFDMSGNLREWVEGGLLMGGSYSSSQAELQCDAYKTVGNDPLAYTPTAGDGFRCCQDIAIQ